VLLLITVGCYALWDSGQVVKAADAHHYEVYEPYEEHEGHSFAELQAINPEVFAWLTVYGTHIDYPVEQATNNMKYISTNAEGKYSLTGGIFLDAANRQDFTSFPSILYGHHMEKQAMFGEIGNFSDKTYFEARRYGMLYFDGQEHGLEFFAFVQADAYDRKVFKGDTIEVTDRETYLALLRSRALHTREVAVSAEDRIVLLSTCSDASTNGRDILVAKITDEVYPNPFGDQAEADNHPPVVDDLAGWWAQTPWWVKTMLLSLGLFLLALLVWSIVKKIRGRNQPTRLEPDAVVKQP